MYSDKIIFAQVTSFLSTKAFRNCVKKYRGDQKIKNFTCWDQFLCMAFAQLTFRESLRDIESCLRSLPNKLYHMGFRTKISRNTLADANEKKIGEFMLILHKYASIMPENYILPTTLALN